MPERERSERLPRAVRTRALELISLGCREKDAVSQAQGERNVRARQRLRIIREVGLFSWSDLKQPHRHYSYGSLGNDTNSFIRKHPRLVELCGSLDRVFGVGER